MCNSCFWSGVGIGMMAGFCVGMKMQGGEKDIKRVIHRTAKKLEDAVDSLNR